MVAASSPPGDSGPVTEEGIRRLVELFYGRVRHDPQIGPVFARTLGESEESWQAHFARLRDFWSSLMLRSGCYRGDAFSAHLRLLPDLDPDMFDRWLALFGETCAELFEPGVADVFRNRAERVARSLRMGLFERLPARAAGRQDMQPPPVLGEHP